MKKRTAQQNKALWKFYELLAQTLNDAGYDMRRTLKHDVDIPWTKNSVHDYLWIPIQTALTEKESTTDLDTVEPSQIHEVLSRHLASKLGVSVPPWPCEETQQEEQRG